MIFQYSSFLSFAIVLPPFVFSRELVEKPGMSAPSNDEEVITNFEQVLIKPEFFL